MFGGWDINKLVEGATALVSDAQQDIASWDRREDATDASTSAELEGALAPRLFLAPVQCKITEYLNKMVRDLFGYCL